MRVIFVFPHCVLSITTLIKLITVCQSYYFNKYYLYAFIKGLKTIFQNKRVEQVGWCLYLYSKWCVLLNNPTRKRMGLSLKVVNHDKCSAIYLWRILNRVDLVLANIESKGLCFEFLYILVNCVPQKLLFLQMVKTLNFDVLELLQ